MKSDEPTIIFNTYTRYKSKEETVDIEIISGNDYYLVGDIHRIYKEKWTNDNKTIQLDPKNNINAARYIYKNACRLYNPVCNTTGLELPIPDPNNIISTPDSYITLHDAFDLKPDLPLVIGIDPYGNSLFSKPITRPSSFRVVSKESGTFTSNGSAHIQNIPKQTRESKSWYDSMAESNMDYNKKMLDLISIPNDRFNLSPAELQARQRNKQLKFGYNYGMTNARLTLSPDAKIIDDAFNDILISGSTKRDFVDVFIDAIQSFAKRKDKTSPINITISRPIKKQKEIIVHSMNNIKL